MRRDPSSLRSVGMTGTRLLSSVLYHLYIAFMRSFASLCRDDRYAIIALFYLYSVLCTLFREHPCILEVNMHAVLVRLSGEEIFILGKVYSV